MLLSSLVSLFGGQTAAIAIVHARILLDPGTGSTLHTILGMWELRLGNAICDLVSLRN
jgi:hypothetical protein